MVYVLKYVGTLLKASRFVYHSIFKDLEFEWNTDDNVSSKDGCIWLQTYFCKL